jgi:hypothetical protein
MDPNRSRLYGRIHPPNEKLPEKPNIAEIEALLFAEQRQLLLNIFQGIVDQWFGMF